MAEYLRFPIVGEFGEHGERDVEGGVAVGSMRSPYGCESVGEGVEPSLGCMVVVKDSRLEVDRRGT